MVTVLAGTLASLGTTGRSIDGALNALFTAFSALSVDPQSSVARDEILGLRDGIWPVGAAVEALARHVPIDLRLSAFPLGAAARTPLYHMSMVLLRTAPDAFLILCFRSMAKTGWHEIETALRSLAEFPRVVASAAVVDALLEGAFGFATGAGGLGSMTMGLGVEMGASGASSTGSGAGSAIVSGGVISSTGATATVSGWASGSFAGGASQRLTSM